jgi:hypothetical protein
MLFFELTLVFGLVGVSFNIASTWAVFTLSFAVAFQIVTTVPARDLEGFRDGFANRFG